jgi:anti-sigma B factor antagonist
MSLQGGGLAVVADPQLDSGAQQPELTVIHPRAGLCEIEVRCELDMLTGPSLTQLLLQELGDECRGLIVDMSGCEFLGSSGLAALLEGKQQADSTSIPIVLAGMNRIATRALQATGLESMFRTYPSAEEAVSALSD